MDRSVITPGNLPREQVHKQYIDENVKDPTDFIVLDHNDIEMELMKSGMDSITFWNVWRLTPEVYQRRPESEWIIKRELRKLDDKGIKERAEYVLDATISLFITADQKNAGVRDAEYRRYYVRLRETGVPVHEKADKNSNVVARTPQGVEKIFVDFIVPALKGEGRFWQVVHFDEKFYIQGYIHEDAAED
ncbi:MAG: hypothetical protein HY788_23185 [Deltaproteobacteria bacterium]|nr:hypothetical protein [Deltaproteobacteria bacterium]